MSVDANAFREGRNFCKITILEDCSIKYRALYSLGRMMRGDFLANKEYIVSKYGDRITFLQIQPDYEMFELYLPRKIVDMCLQENNLFILSDDAIHVYSLKTRILTEKAVTLNSKPVSMEVNHEAMAILDTDNDIIVYSLPGKRSHISTQHFM